MSLNHGAQHLLFTDRNVKMAARSIYFEWSCIVIASAPTTATVMGYSGKPMNHPSNACRVVGDYSLQKVGLYCMVAYWPNFRPNCSQSAVRVHLLQWRHQGYRFCFEVICDVLFAFGLMEKYTQHDRFTSLCVVWPLEWISQSHTIIIIIWLAWSRKLHTSSHSGLMPSSSFEHNPKLLMTRLSFIW